MTTMSANAVNFRTSIASLLALTLLALSLDAEAGRRSLRIEFEDFGWSAAQSLGTSDCPGSVAGGTTVSWKTFRFSGFPFGEIYNVDNYCQNGIPYDSNNPDDPYFSSTYSFSGSDDSGIRQKVGENTSNSTSARVYSYMDRDRFDENVRGYQWEFYFFGGGATLVRLNANISGNPNVYDTDGATLWDSNAFYDGQFFCFDDGEYVGIWDGSSSAGSSPLAGCEMPPPVDECVELEVYFDGDGDVPLVSPVSSLGCPAGQYERGELITMTARPAPGWKVGEWSAFDYVDPGMLVIHQEVDDQGEGEDGPIAVVGVTYQEALTCPSDFAKVSWLDEDMEDGAAGWSHSAPVGSDTWTLQQDESVSPTNAWNGRVVDVESDQRLVSPPVTIPADASSVVLSYYNQRDFDFMSSCDEGAILEYSTDGGANWAWMAPDNFTLDAPNGGILWDTGYPADPDQRGWCGGYFNSPVSEYFVPWRLAEADLSALAGETVNFRFRFGTDEFGPETGGWWIDDVTVAGCMPDVILRDGFESP